jgi:triosephosphate isomerase
MLEDVGVSAVLVGHSERRHVLKEQNQLVNAKCLAALNAWMQVVFCVGEKIEHRESNQMERVITDQLTSGLEGVTSEQMAQVTIAYEPVWAIGTGHAATPADAQVAHTAIRNHLAKMFGHLLAQTVRIQYGGSVNPKNAAELFAQPDVDGFLVGGASLVADHFLAIIDVAR